MDFLDLGPIIEAKLELWLSYNTEAIPKVLIPNYLYPETRFAGWVTRAYGYVECFRYDGDDILVVECPEL